MKRVVVAVILAALPFGGTQLYFWMWRDYYSGRYEEAFLPQAIAALASVVGLVAAVAVGIHWYRSSAVSK